MPWRAPLMHNLHPLPAWWVPDWIQTWQWSITASSIVRGRRQRGQLPSWYWNISQHFCSQVIPWRARFLRMASMPINLLFLYRLGPCSRATTFGNVSERRQGNFAVTVTAVGGGDPPRGHLGPFSRQFGSKLAGNNWIAKHCRQLHDQINMLILQHLSNGRHINQWCRGGFKPRDQIGRWMYENSEREHWIDILLDLAAAHTIYPILSTTYKLFTNYSLCKFYHNMKSHRWEYDFSYIFNW